MIIIGLVLLIAAAVFGLDLIWKNHYAIHSPAPVRADPGHPQRRRGSSSSAQSPAPCCCWESR
jgi:hypothetical protein